jgi:Flp pilus assembly pilin Flp
MVDREDKPRSTFQHKTLFSSVFWGAKVTFLRCTVMKIHGNQRNKRNKRGQSGQGLVEYALILALVALVVIISLTLMRLSTMRGIGQVTAALGGQRSGDDSAGFNISFDPNQPPQCGYLQGVNKTGISVRGSTNVPLSDIVATTENSNQILGLMPDGTNRFAAYTILADGRDHSVCPKGIVIQTKPESGGMTILHPVITKDWP